MSGLLAGTLRRDRSVSILLVCLPLILSGEIVAQVGNVTLYSATNRFSVDLRSATITDLSVDNHGSTTSGTVTVEIWASTSVPSIGGNTSHALMGSYVLGTVPANYHRDVPNTGSFPISPPSPGTYWLSFALTEDRGSGGVLEFIYTDPQARDLGGPFFFGWDGTVAPGNTLYFGKPLSYSVSGTTASLQVGLIQNYAGGTRSIRLEVWALGTPMHWGDSVQRYRLLVKDLAPLAPGGSAHNLDTGPMPFVDVPPAGLYWITAVLLSQDNDGIYRYYSLYDFSTRWTSSGSGPLPYSYLVPSTAHSAGANGAFYTTDLMIANRGASAASFSIQFLGHDADGRSGATMSRQLASNKAVSFADILGSGFGITSSYGAIRVSSDSPSLKVISQTSTPPPDGRGTFGQAIPAFDSSMFVTPSTPKALIGLRQDSGFRTNVVLSNATELSVHVVLSLVSSDGFTYGGAAYDLPPLGMTQVSSVVTALGAPPGTRDAVLVVSTTTPGAQVATYAAIIDNVTNDPRTVLP